MYLQLYFIFDTFADRERSVKVYRASAFPQSEEGAEQWRRGNGEKSE
jgi:hypothetical protein